MSTVADNRASEIARESGFLQLCRVGFIGRGILYLLIGLLVIGTGRTEDLTGALEYLDHGIGRLLLIAITVGLASYGLWRLADAGFGIEHPGSDGRALAKRGAAAGIGLIYIYLSYKAARIVLAGSPGDSGARGHAETVLHLPGGDLVLGGAAIVLGLAGLNQLRKAVQCRFLRNLDARAASTTVKWLGRIGYSARGIIFLLVAVLIGRSAIRHRSTDAGGMEQALDLLSGPILYAVAAGLMLFGLFSIIEGLFRHLHEPTVEEMKQQVRENLGS